MLDPKYLNEICKLISLVGTSIDTGVWVIIECNIGIVSACVPVYRPFLSRLNPKRLSKAVSKNSKVTNSKSNSGDFLPLQGLNSTEKSTTTLQDEEANMIPFSKMGGTATTTTTCVADQNRPGREEDRESGIRWHKTWYSSVVSNLNGKG